ncbi:MAG TPA: glycoside hydrolase family 15 protein, partial [Gemmatimonadales bacterium]|nr:glycoside hydrolase family 15 protein [Gemmatimonadales bacterium]
LFAARGETALACAATPDWTARSCGYVGVSDGWQQVRADGRLARQWSEARGGNVALTGEIDLQAARAGEGAEFVVALAFGRTDAEAGQTARLALASPVARLIAAYVEGWQHFHTLTAHVGRAAEAGAQHLPATAHALYHLSTAIVALHEDKRAQGGLIASLSIPWGQARGDHDMGGYHLVWPRDLVESAGAMMAAGQLPRARRTLRYLMATQEADGHWPQNMWLDGSAYWHGIQMDETAFPVLLADALARADALGGLDPWPAVRRAAGYLVRHGPVTLQDRWEEDGGYSPFTLAVEVAALLAAASFADARGDPAAAACLRDTADAWNDDIERWTYVTGTALAERLDVAGYYARIAPPDVGSVGSDGRVPLRNRPPDRSWVRYADLVSTDALALVRFGLRAADDPRIVDTVKVIDSLLRTETRTGPVWHRYNGDGYGEPEDGAPFEGVGIGRGWPLLAGERAHYELAAGRRDAARALLEVMCRQASDGGMLPEQVWDAADVPQRGLYNGRPSGSAMPLVWAHAEYVKLVRSLADGRVFDCPPHPVRRYLVERRTACCAVWSPANRIRAMAPARVLRLHVPQPCRVHWSADGWRTTHDTDAADTTLGVWAAELPTTALAAGSAVVFTLFWPRENRWQGENYTVRVEP